MTIASLIRVLRFALVGGFTTLVHVVVATSLWEWAWSPVLSNGVAFTVATVLGYVLHTGWSFKQAWTPENAMRYLVVTVLGIGLSAGLAWVAEVREAPRWTALLATIIAIPSLSYGAHLAWTYQRSDIDPRRKTSDAPAWWPDVLGLASLVAFGLVLHGSAFEGGWRWDDGTHLLRTTQYSLSEMFFRPEVMRYVSGNQIAPMNLALYWLNTNVFGLWPSMFYAVHLLSLALALLGVWLVWRLWWPTHAAWAGGVVLLLGVPTGQMAQQLMVGHYILGLAFASAAFWAMQRSWQTPHRHRAWVWSVAAALAYALACLSKEVYVPLIFPLLLWAVLPLGMPSLVWRERWLRVGPVLLVAVLYTVGRWYLFRGVGGYQQGTWDAQTLQHALQAWSVLLGGGISGMVGVSLLVMAWGSLVCLSSIRRTLHILAWLMGMGLPLMWIMAARPDWQAHTRYLWVLWVAVACVWVAWFALPWQRLTSASHERRHRRATVRDVVWCWGSWGAFVCVLWMASIHQLMHDQMQHRVFDAHMQHIQGVHGQEAVWPPTVNGQGYLTAVMSAAHVAEQFYKNQASATSASLPSLHLLSPQDVYKVPADTWVWDEPSQALVRWGTWNAAQQSAYFAVHAVDWWLSLPLKPPWPPLADGVQGRLHVQHDPAGGWELRGEAPILGRGTMAVVLGLPSQALQPIWLRAFGHAASASSGLTAFKLPIQTSSAAPQVCVVVQSQHLGEAHRFMVLADAATGQIAPHCAGLLRPSSVKAVSPARRASLGE